MSAGLIGFLVVLALAVACVFLFRSMTRHLRNVPKSFDAVSSEEGDGTATDDQSGGSRR